MLSTLLSTAKLHLANLELKRYQTEGRGLTRTTNPLINAYKTLFPNSKTSPAKLEIYAAVAEAGVTQLRGFLSLVPGAHLTANNTAAAMGIQALVTITDTGSKLIEPGSKLKTSQEEQDNAIVQELSQALDSRFPSGSPAMAIGTAFIQISQQLSQKSNIDISELTKDITDLGVKDSIEKQLRTLAWQYPSIATVFTEITPSALKGASEQLNHGQLDLPDPAIPTDVSGIYTVSGN